MPEFETHSQHACCRCSWRFPFPWSPQKNWLVMKLSWITECRKRNTNSADRQCWCSGLWCKLPLAFRTVSTMHMQVAWNTHPRRPVNPTWYREKMGEVRRHQKTMYIVYTMYRYVQVIMINFVGFVGSCWIRAFHWFQLYLSKFCLFFVKFDGVLSIDSVFRNHTSRFQCTMTSVLSCRDQPIQSRLGQVAAFLWISYAYYVFFWLSIQPTLPFGQTQLLSGMEHVKRNMKNSFGVPAGKNHIIDFA